MARISTIQHAFDVGVYDRKKLHRVDVDRVRLGASRQTNIMADSVGTAFLRPGTLWVSDETTERRPLPFISGVDESYQVLVGDLNAKVYDDQLGAFVSYAALVGSTVSDGNFNGGGGWTLAATSGQSTTIAGGELVMIARAHGGKAQATQTIAVNAADVGKECCLKVMVTRGPVTFRVGSSSGLDNLIAETDLRTGEHYLAFTLPAANYYITFLSTAPVNRKVTSCQTFSGTLSITAPWAVADIDLIRTQQSLDVMFCAADGYKPQRVERRSNGRSWSICDYDVDDGPFSVGRTAAVRLKPGATEGNTTLTASAAFFNANHVGALFKLRHNGQRIETYVADEDQWTPAFLMTGITETNFEERKFTVTIAGTWVGTLRHQRSFDGEFGDYHDYRRAQTVATVDITANASYTNDDNDDNTEVWVRMGFPDGQYTSGEAQITFYYPGGYGYGICRVIAYNSPTSVDIEILRPFRGKFYTDDWQEGRWSAQQGWPTAVAIHDGRLIWMGKDQIDASVSDAYESFDETFVGDAGPISRAIAISGRNNARWGLGLSSLLIGCDSLIANVRASALDEIVTPSNFSVKSSARVGAAPLSPIELGDDRALFVGRSGRDIYEITWDGSRGRYAASPYCKLSSDTFAAGIKSWAVSSTPDQRIWVVMDDGTAAVILDNGGENSLPSVVPIETAEGDLFQHVAVLPGTTQDRVFFTCKRASIFTNTYTFERMVTDDEANVSGGAKVGDCMVAVTASSATITALPKALWARTLYGWGDGAPIVDAAITDPSLDNALAMATTSSSLVSRDLALPAAYTTGWVGLRYVAEYMSGKLGYGIQGYSPALRNKAVASLGFSLADFVRDGLKFGTARDDYNYSATWSLSALSAATGDTADNVVSGVAPDEFMFSAGSDMSPDVRVCFGGQTPKPFTVLTMVMDIETI